MHRKEAKRNWHCGGWFLSCILQWWVLGKINTSDRYVNREENHRQAQEHTGLMPNLLKSMGAQGWMHQVTAEQVRDKGKGPAHGSVCSDDSGRHWALRTMHKHLLYPPVPCCNTCRSHTSSWRGRKPSWASCSTGTLPTQLAASSAHPPCWGGLLSDGDHSKAGVYSLWFYSKSLQITWEPGFPVVPGVLGAPKHLGGCSYLLSNPVSLSGILSLCCTNAIPSLLQQQQVSGPFAPVKERMEAATPQEAPCSKWFLTSMPYGYVSTCSLFFPLPLQFPSAKRELDCRALQVVDENVKKLKKTP